MLQELINKLNNELPGYHVEIQLHPSGGMINASGCEECNTDEEKFETTIWSVKKCKNKTIDDAVNELKNKLGLVTQHCD